MAAASLHISGDSIFIRLRELLLAQGFIKPSVADSITSGSVLSPISADGSTRRFWRMEAVHTCDHNRSLLIVAPASNSRNELAESESVWKIGTHLKRCGVNVPDIYGWDKQTGILIFEDLGDTRLHDLVNPSCTGVCKKPEGMSEIYLKVLEGLVTMQLQGSREFADAWCWDTPKYDTVLMVERESKYFLKAFWQGLLSLDVPKGILHEFHEIASRAAEAPAEYFLHRDFQSRNIMIKDGAPWFIDFQGGRFGPLGYDLASLLIDPYCCLSFEIQEQLFDQYAEILRSRTEIDKEMLKEQYNLLALQRNLQIIGAFSFLYMVRKKNFFRKYIEPALHSLITRLEMGAFADFPLLKSMAFSGLREFTR